MLKIFVKNRCIALSNNEIKIDKNSTVVIDKNLPESEIKKNISSFIKNESEHVLHFFTNNIEDLLKKIIASGYNYIEAAGGAVKNDKGNTLFIFRNNKWDLPKGKIESGETPENAAIREVEEECGIEGLTIKSKLPPTYHIYTQNKKKYFKKTFWYLMHSNYNNSFKPQTEEGVTLVEWVKKSDYKKIKENTYQSVIELMHNLN